MELLVTMVVISTILLGLLAVQTSALSTVTLSRERQQATDLANRGMEQLRASPYDVVAAGSRNTDGTLTSDPNVTSGRYRPTFDSSIDEILVTSGAATSMPLFPHIQSNADTKIGDVQFSVATYVTLVSTTAGDTSKGYWLSVVVSWSSPRTKGRTLTTQVRSQAYSPTGCLSTATHPFSGPCQAFFEAAANAAPAGITISARSGPAIAGNPLTSATVGSPTLAAVVQSEQIVSTQSASATSQATYVTDTGEATSGGVSASTAATTDPASGAGTAPADDSTTQSGGTLVSPGTGSEFQLTAGPSDAVRAASTTRAMTTAAPNGCRTITDASVASNEVCSSGQVIPGGPLKAVLDYGAAVPLASIEEAAAPSRTMTSRFTAAGPTLCPTASAAGCIAAHVARYAGTARIGGAPSAASSLPPGFTAMATVTGYSSSARAESGLGAAAPSASRTGTLTFVDDATGAMTSVDLATASAQTRTVRPVTYTYADPAGVPLTVVMTGTVTIGAVDSASSGTSPCQPTVCGVQSTAASVVASVTYDIKAGDAQFGYFTVALDLGAVTAKTSYRAAPSA